MSPLVDTEERTIEDASFAEVVEIEAGHERDVFPEVVHSNAYEVKYTCLLIPRFPAHQLVGDIADYLPQWLQQICISHGWRLEYAEVSPTHFEWIISVLVSVPPARFMGTITRQTSQMIFSEFGRLRREVLSDEFWAKGYLVVMGDEPFPDEMTRKFIRMVRHQQGLDSF